MVPLSAALDDGEKEEVGGAIGMTGFAGYYNLFVQLTSIFILLW